jgi:hypothetical protein
MGGGLGHLVRARAFVHSVGFEGRVTLITSSALARDPRVAPGVDVVVAPEELDRQPSDFRSWLFRQLEQVAADRLCLDTFPAGILGELAAGWSQGLKLWHVARRLRWENYAPRLREVRARQPSEPELRFDQCWQVEALHPEQQAFLEQHCDEITPLDLRDPPAPNSAPLRERSYWLVVHSGPSEEVADLVEHALEMRAIERAQAPIYVATQCQPRFEHPEASTIDVFPATPYFEGAERLVTAAGFNVLRQTQAYRHKQTIIPMPRRYDDQCERARSARAGT